MGKHCKKSNTFLFQVSASWHFIGEKKLSAFLKSKKTCKSILSGTLGYWKRVLTAQIECLLENS